MIFTVYLAAMGVFIWFKKSMSTEDKTIWEQQNKLEEC